MKHEGTRYLFLHIYSYSPRITLNTDLKMTPPILITRVIVQEAGGVIYINMYPWKGWILLSHH